MPAIAANLREIAARVQGACARAGRSSAAVTLVAVSKTFPATAIDEAVAAGVTDIGENKVQEFRAKSPLLQSSPRRHLIGHLQSNKVNEAVRLFDVIQTVDSAELAARLDRAAARENKVLDVLLQVNIGAEAQKSGCSPRELDALAAHVATLPHLRLAGLMTIPPAVDGDPLRLCFSRMRDLRDRLHAIHPGLIELSMGMSDDFEVALEEGATIIRLGRAIFGSRG